MISPNFVAAKLEGYYVASTQGQAYEQIASKFCPCMIAY